MIPRKQKLIDAPLVFRDRIILPNLHIKLGLIKEFVKPFKKDDHCFRYIAKAFPNLSSEKIKAVIFDGPQIRNLIEDKEFINYMTGIEKYAWEEFVFFSEHLFGKQKVYIQHVEQLPIHFQQLG